MKIIELQAENIKRLVCVSIKPDGNMVEITGKNGQGKTSVLDAIWWALEGKENIQSTPIRKGAKEARIKLDLGELKVTRTFKSKDDGYTTSIVVEKADGARFPTPQTVLDGLLGELSFDPLAFTRMKAAEQLNTLKRFVPGVDFDKIESDKDALYNKRTDVNRRAKDLRSQAAGIPIPSKLPERVSEAELIDAMEAAGQKNAELEQRKARREAAEQERKILLETKTRLFDEVADLRLRADALAAEAKKADEKASEIFDRLEAADPLPNPIDVSDIKEKLAAAKANNAVLDQAEQRKKLDAQADVLEKESEDLTKKRDDLEAQKVAAIAEAKLPVPGVSFGDGCVLMGGLPFDQASDAEQLRASIAIAAAMNPTLRVLRVRDGSLLDEDAMKLLAQFADENDMQVWIERVDSSGRVGFVLEDGHLKGAEKAEAA